MTDTPNQTPDPAGANDAADDDARKARTDAIHVLARALWKEGLLAAPEADNGEDAAGPGQGRAEWKEKRRDYVKLATRLFKRLDRQGATLAVSPDKAVDADAD